MDATRTATTTAQTTTMVARASVAVLPARPRPAEARPHPVGVRPEVLRRRAGGAPGGMTLDRYLAMRREQAGA